MYQTIRKTVSLLLAVVLILACGVMAVAAAPKTAEQQASCTHSWNAGYTQKYGSKMVYLTNETCAWRYVTTKTCVKCGQTNVTYSYGTPYLHDGRIQSASCDGSLQTHNMRCSNCDGYYTVTEPCPKPHPGRSCPYLPI